MGYLGIANSGILESGYPERSGNSAITTKHEGKEKKWSHVLSFLRDLRVRGDIT